MKTNLDAIKEFLVEVNVPIFTNDNIDVDYLRLPRDLTVLPTQEISKYLNAIVQQKMYVRTLVSQARAIYREAKSDFDKEKCRVFASAPPKMSVTEKELRVFQDIQAEESRRYMEQSLEKYDFLKDILESYDDGTFLVSRELTRRMKDFEDMGRAGKFNA